MESYFDLVIYKDVFVEVHAPGRRLERVSRASVCVPIGERLPFPYDGYLRFMEYIYDEDGKPVGAKIQCDHGGGYYVKDEKTVEKVRLGQTVSFTHNWTGVDDDGCPEDNCVDVKFQLVAHEEPENRLV